jgi:hypothetical protein
VLRGRREVANFARRILATLNCEKNAAKPGWKDMSLHEMIGKLDEEYKELGAELRLLGMLDRGSMTAQRLKERRQRIAEEATDLGAVCMMIADNVGGLDDSSV